MKIVVIGGTGRIGSRVVATLRQHGHDAVPASPDTGVNTVTGEGLRSALDGADVVVDVSNSPSLEPDAAMEFFTKSTTNLLATEAAAGVRHHVALSVVGTDRMSEGGYFRAKMAQEALIAASPIPYSIVHATQFFEFLQTIASAATTDGAVRLPPVLIQPMAADDVASAIGKTAVGAPVLGVVEAGGPEQFRLDELVRRYLQDRSDDRVVITDPGARYFGVALDVRTLVPGPNARVGTVRYEDWMGRSARPNAATSPSATSATRPALELPPTDRSGAQPQSGASPQSVGAA